MLPDHPTNAFASRFVQTEHTSFSGGIGIDRVVLLKRCSILPP